MPKICLAHSQICTHETLHYSEVVMSEMASQITGVLIAHPTVFSGADQRKCQAPRHWPMWGNSPVTAQFPAQKASNAENNFIWWRHHEIIEGNKIISPMRMHGFFSCTHGPYKRALPLKRTVTVLCAFDEICCLKIIHFDRLCLYQYPPCH